MRQTDSGNTGITSEGEDGDEEKSTNVTEKLLPREGLMFRSVESQLHEEEKDLFEPVTAASEYLVSTRTKMLHLSAYFMFNLTLTIYNKAVLGKVCQSPDFLSDL